MTPQKMTLEERAFIQEHIQMDVSTLALQMRKYPHLNAALVLNQVAGWQDIVRKVPAWMHYPELLFPSKLSLEQCSSERTAAYKVALIDALEGVESVADLTGGLGVDFSFLAKGRSKSFYVERQSELCALVAHNLSVLGLEAAHVVHADGGAWLAGVSSVFDLIFVDPARRDSKGSKVSALSDCEPDLTTLRPLLMRQSRYTLIKLSPMLDISLAFNQMPETIEVHVVSVEGECKELLFLLSSEVQAQEPTIHAVNLRNSLPNQVLTFLKSEEQAEPPLFAAVPLNYLYEPNASVLKAGPFGLLTRRYNVHKLHPNSHLYTSTEFVADFPGRCFEVERYFPIHSKSLKKELTGLSKANMTVRNFPESVDSLRKKTGLKEGGSVYLFATTLLNESKVFILCKMINR